MAKLIDGLREAWSPTKYGYDELHTFAVSRLVGEAQNGLRTTSLVLAMLYIAAFLVYAQSALDYEYFYAYALIAALCVHTYRTAGRITDVTKLYRLGGALLVSSAVALLFVAYSANEIGPLLLTNFLLLFVVIPLIPWGLRQACIVVFSIWLLVTAFSVTGVALLASDTVVLLQVFMLTTAFAGLAIVARATASRKGDVTARHDLVKAQTQLERLSNVDPLTGAWNRQYMKCALKRLHSRYGEEFGSLHYVLVDLDDFRRFNDAYGSHAGDDVLICIATALREHVDQRGFVLRLSGDEFCALFVANDPDELMRGAIEDVRNRIRGIGGIRGTKISLSYSHTVTTLDLGAPIPELYRQSDEKMRQTKNENRDEAQCHLPDRLDDSGTWLVLGSEVNL